MTTVLHSLNQALFTALSTDRRVILLGEDILDPYGGAFKVTQGCSTAHPDQVWTTPISEAGIVGIATGMAMRGLLPVVEIMFGDFTTLIADQVLNHLSKFRWMYNNQVQVPLVIRTPMGGRRGYGPTHSQTLEKHFLGVPGLHVVAATNISDPGKLLLQAIFDDTEPVLFIENKVLYPLQILEPPGDNEINITIHESEGSYPVYLLTVRNAPRPQITLAVYGYMVELARQAMLRLAYEQEIFCEIVAYTQLSPFELTVLQEAVHQTRRLLVVEEGTLTLGWGAEVLARMAELEMQTPIIMGRLASANHPVPASPPLEANTLPGVQDIIAKVNQLLKT